MNRLLAVLVLAAVVGGVAVLTAWRVHGPPPDLSWTAVAEVTTLDPARMTAVQDGRVAAALFEGLTVLDPRDLAPRPGVAERWEVLPDGRTWTFHLRPDARWSDGRPVTAGDFDYAWRRVLNPRTASEYVYMLWPIRGARASYQARAAGRHVDPASVGIGVESDRRLRVELERPTPYFLSLVAFSTYLPVRRDVAEGPRGGERPRWTMPPNLVSNGAYRLVAWRFQGRMLWERNPHYWNASEVALERIEVRVYEQPNTALLAYETGAIDLTTSVPALAVPPLLEARRQGRRADVLYGPNLGTYFYRFNCRRPPLDDPRVRRALALAVDRGEIIERAARGGQMPATTFVPPGLAGYERPEGLAEDVERARALLAEAGHPKGRGLRELAILVNEGADHRPIAEMVQQQWRRALGVRTRIAQVEWKVSLDLITRGEYDVARSGWFGDYLDPNTFLDLFVTGGGNNRTGWSNSAYDRLIDEAAGELGPGRRMALFRRAERILLDEVPVVPLYFYSTVVLARPELEGIYPNLLNRIDFGLVRWRAPAEGAPADGTVAARRGG